MLFLGRNMLAVEAAAAVVSAGVTPLGRECPVVDVTLPGTRGASSRGEYPSVTCLC